MIIVNSNNTDYDQIITCLQRGGVIVYPTDTAYALGADAESQEAIEKIFKLKGREAGKTLPLIVADRQMAERWAVFSARAHELANKHWPGPLTLVLPIKDDNLSASIVQDGFIALRLPDSGIARELSRALGKPLVSTSANASGQSSCYSIKEVERSLGGSLELVDYIIDAGELPSRAVSTMVKIIGDNIEILRPGVVQLSSSC